MAGKAGLRVGVIGCGNISRFHFAGIEAAGSIVHGVCDLNEEASKPRAAQYGCYATTDWRRITDDPDIDAVHVTVVSRLHKEICLAAIEAGKAVICEKTLSESAADSAKIVRAASEQGTILYTSFMKRFIPAVQQAKTLLPSIGRIMSAEFHSYQSWGDNWNGAPAGDFFAVDGSGSSAVRRAYGGGILVCGGSHILDLILHFFGRPKRLYASVYQPEYLDLDLRATAQLEYDGFPVRFEALAHPNRRIGFLRDGWEEGFEILGTGGRLRLLSSLWDSVDTKASVLLHYDNETGNETEYRYSPESPFSRAIALFHENIAAGTQGEQSRSTGYDVDLLIDTIASADGRVVDIIGDP